MIRLYICTVCKQIFFRVSLNIDQGEGRHPYQEKEPLEAWPNDVNPHTGEVGMLS